MLSSQISPSPWGDSSLSNVITFSWLEWEDLSIHPARTCTIFKKLNKLQPHLMEDLHQFLRLFEGSGDFAEPEWLSIYSFARSVLAATANPSALTPVVCYESKWETILPILCGLFSNISKHLMLSPPAAKHASFSVLVAVGVNEILMWQISGRGIALISEK